jgi:hypothetical protein
MPPLAGVTVADLTRYLPSPFASRELQRLGAAPAWSSRTQRDWLEVLEGKDTSVGRC